MRTLTSHRRERSHAGKDGVHRTHTLDRLAELLGIDVVVKQKPTE
jgi:hypothetical protein